MSGARFPVPAQYAGDPPAAEGLRQALTLATEAELQFTISMLAAGAKMAAGLGPADPVTEPLEGTAALLGWLSAVVSSELERRGRLFGDLEAGHAAD